jgi:hypothetical protein
LKLVVVVDDVVVVVDEETKVVVLVVLVCVGKSLWKPKGFTQSRDPPEPSPISTPPDNTFLPVVVQVCVVGWRSPPHPRFWKRQHHCFFSSDQADLQFAEAWAQS